MAIDKIAFGDQLQLLRGVEGIPGIRDGQSNKTEKVKGSQSFGDFLVQQLEQVNTDGLEAERTINRTIQGKEENPHAAVIAVQKAEISLTLLMSVKERIERAYQELIKTQM